ncbi:hypothetical protein [Sphingomonas sp. LaA6.9]|uniref:hypothetical protein n=1 Tax=Sphingomonas sp. LaA6.9 TaxID=2919914 RepID=UPI001F4FB5C5|nr:hypothetical protein [Sphingomonas sp. LaA6.9]MCJ8156978.1 hypothetical protein [Sphingomonas sp. LaA6.9]
MKRADCRTMAKFVLKVAREPKAVSLVCGGRQGCLINLSWVIPMHSHSAGNASPAGKTEYVPGPAIGAMQVSHDMETIFGGADPLPDGEASVAAGSTMLIVSRSSANRLGKRRTLALTGVAIAGVLGISIILAPRGIPDPSPRQIVTPPSQVDLVSRGPTFVESAAAPAVPSSRVNEAATETSPAVKSPTRPRSTTDNPKRKSTQRLATKSAPKAHRSRASTSCKRMGGMELARCMRPQILAADRQLRNAYNDAVRSGVDRRTLVAYHRQWSKLRRRANSDPRSVTAGYRQMAEQLDATRTGGRAGDI